ncbi:hypothetical protein DHBDCA_p1248 [Dehalobacter sp. DCA]|uniref:hypothetical protein n=1 Tax=Dehalobacter sp. DCA TaxID=1147129 RepID=UPI00028B490B|nr:hypothetical protein [Dehalobacter sp. DCA]AFV02277.1 hypothetical protein DHBDCA_p1248 [Dehalobacter sp. DCA]
MKKEKHPQNLEAELQQAFDRWEALYKFGGHDPFWSDGCNLNLVRNHISHYKQKIEESYEPQNYPAIFYREAPPEVSQDYMARSEEIWSNAKKVIQLYKKDENYQFLLSHVERLDPKDIKTTSIRNVINYVKGLEQAIAADDLISMRRHENPEGYIESFLECAERVKSLKPRDNEQLSLFDVWPENFTEESDECEEEDQGMNMRL